MLAVRFLLVGLVAALLVAPALASAAPPPVVPIPVYVADVSAGDAAIVHFGNIFKNTTGIDALLKKQVAVRRSIITFDRHLYAISRYRLADPTLDGQRARLAKAAPAVTETLFDFFDAVLTKNLPKVKALVPTVQARLAAYAKAAE